MASLNLTTALNSVPGRAPGDATELPAAAVAVDDLEVAVGAAPVVVRLESTQLELFQSELRGKE